MTEVTGSYRKLPEVTGSYRKLPEVTGSYRKFEVTRDRLMTTRAPNCTGYGSHMILYDAKAVRKRSGAGHHLS